MPKVGFEPTWEYSHYALNVARLPVSPLRLQRALFYTNTNDCQQTRAGCSKSQYAGSSAEMLSPDCHTCPAERSGAGNPAVLAWIPRHWHPWQWQCRRALQLK